MIWVQPASWNGHVFASLDKTLYDDNLILLSLKKQQILWTRTRKNLPKHCVTGNLYKQVRIAPNAKYNTARKSLRIIQYLTLYGNRRINKHYNKTTQHTQMTIKDTAIKCCINTWKKVKTQQDKIMQKPLIVCDVLILNQHHSNTKSLTSTSRARSILLVGYKSIKLQHFNSLFNLVSYLVWQFPKLSQ